MDTRTPSDLGRRIRALREERSLTIRQLAQASGVPPASINGLEVGRQQSISPLRLLKISRALGTSIEALIPSPDTLATTHPHAIPPSQAP